jgi:hypothetical protein
MRKFDDRVKSRDWLGALVRLQRDILLRNGTILKAGSICTVDSTWRGKMTLTTNGTIIARHVDRQYLELVAEKLA